MKQKILMLLAVVLLSSASAFAQSGNSEPLKGDVNGDGMVDVADIAAIIDIMANGGGTVDGKQYWYIGVTDPYTFDTIGQKGNDNLDVWFEKPVIRGSVSDEIDWDVHYWYVAVPSSWNAIIYDFTNGATFIGVVFSATTRTKIIGGVEYTIWKSIAQTTDTSLCLHMENGVITNKWFKGDTDPATLDYVGQTKTAWDTWTEGTSITNTKVALVDDDLNDHIWYFAFPQSWNVTTMLSSDNATPVPAATYTVTNNVNIGGSLYTVFAMKSASDAITAYFKSEAPAAVKKYVYAGQQDPTNTSFSFSSVVSSESTIIQEITDKVPVTLYVNSETRAPYYICAPNDLGYVIYDSSGTIESTSSYNTTTFVKDGFLYKLWYTGNIKSLDQILK